MNVNPDLVKERKKCTFNTAELTNLLDGGPDKTEERRSRETFFLSDPELQSKVPLEYLSHKEKYEESIRIACALFKKVQELQNEGKGGIENFTHVLGGQLGTAIMKEGNPLSLHFVMFIPTLVGQGTIEQQAEWIQKAWTCDIIGTYAQTELGHGTFIRGLETTATYDQKTEEFVLNSPTLTAYKWWPGGYLKHGDLNYPVILLPYWPCLVGHTANYAVVLAQLYTRGQCHGIHPFIVQLRAEKTHLPMPGIEIGEIGCKLGMNTTNNGYLGFKNVRIPRTNMLMKNNKVLPDGTYVKSVNSKLTYGTMMFVRVVLVKDASRYLQKAVCIATRYSAVRHQSKINESDPEPQILDFVTQQHKLFPLISSCFAFHFSASWLWDVYNNVSSDLDAGQLDSLPELHAIACCLKAVSTADVAAGIETCRLACGGHGYMTSSSFPSTYGLVTAMCTYEGENTVLLLQTARFLIKMWKNQNDAEKLWTMKYITEKRNYPFAKNVDWIISALQDVASGKIELASRHIDERIRSGKTPEVAWNETSVELTQAADAHCRIFLVQIYAQAIESVSVSDNLKSVLWQLVELYAVVTALRYVGDLLRFSTLQGKDVDVLQRWLETLLSEFRPNAVGLVDSFDIRDEILCSTLGAYDGRVYERLFAEAQKSPLNALPVNKSFTSHLKPFLKSNM